MVVADTKSEELASSVLVDTISYSAILFTVGLFSSGTLISLKIHASKSVGAVPHLPFVAAFTNCSLWLMYGQIKPDFTIILVNGIGLILQLSYTVIYHTYADNKYFVRRDFSVSVSIICTVAIYYYIIMLDHDKTMTQLGLICNFFTICFFASPLSTMAEVIRTQSTDSMSFILSVLSILTTLSWTAYGYLIDDKYVMFPNFIGLFLSLVQLSLFLIYPNKPKRTVSLESPT